jgi:hypothetical protein
MGNLNHAFKFSALINPKESEITVFYLLLAFIFQFSFANQAELKKLEKI